MAVSSADKKKLGKWIKQAREKKQPHLSQRQLALAVDITNASLSSIESGMIFPSEELLLKLIEQLQPPPELREKMLALFAKAKGTSPPDINAELSKNPKLWGLIRQLIGDIHVPEYSMALQEAIEELYNRSVYLKQASQQNYDKAADIFETALGITQIPGTAVSVKNFSDSFVKTGRLDSEYYQPKFDVLFDALEKFPNKRLGGNDGIVDIRKSIEPGSEAYKEEGIPFVRVSDISKYEITPPEIFLSHDIVEDVEALFPKKDTILFSKDGSVGIAYKLERDEDIVTSGALLHLTVRNTSEILPDYLTLVLNSTAVQMQAERDSNGAVIQHWKPSEIENVIVPVLDIDKQKELSEMVQKSFALRHQSKQLLEYAKQAVEMAIEQGEDTALAWLKERTGE